MIRPATHTDVPAMVEIMVQRYEASIYAAMGEMSVDRARKLLNLSILGHGRQKAEGTLVMVAEREGRVTAFILGLLEHVYFVGEPLTATDLFFVGREGADLRDVKALAEAFNAWACANPSVVEIKMGVVDTFGTDLNVADRLYRGMGLQRCGAIYRRSIER